MIALRFLRQVLLALLTPLFEKSAVKTLAIDVPVVFSMSRLIVLAFATGMLHQLWHDGIAGWPEATLSVAIVLALPLLGALERVPPDQFLDFSKALLERFGNGAVRSVASTYRGAPSKYDDHRDDGDNPHAVGAQR
jgi:peptidoglycan/LPS O-acetylase OafA/YrhL